MTETWFDGNLYGWIFGTVLGVVGGLLGAAGGTLAPRGKAKGVVLLCWWLMLSVSFVLLLVGLYALYCGQPYGVWYGMLLPGLLGIVIFGLLLPVILKRYREAEQRKLTAQDL
jgi:uncharacterized membrane protein